MNQESLWEHLGLESNPFDPKRRIIHVTDSWQRLISVIRRQADNSGFLLIDAPYGAGKTTFAEVLQKKLILDDFIETHLIQIHPLSNAEQIMLNLDLAPDMANLVILDDAGEASASVLEELLAYQENVYWVLLADLQLKERLAKLQNRRLALPLFNKQDTHKLIIKQFHGSDRNIEISQLDSEIIYYESKGIPRDILRMGEVTSYKLIQNDSSGKGFDLANKGLLSSIVIGVALIVLILFLLLRTPTDVENVLEGEIDPLQVEPTELIFIEPGAEQKDSMSSGELEIDFNKPGKAVIVKQDASNEKIFKPSESLPATSTVEQELTLKESNTKELSTEQQFSKWFESQTSDSYTVQLYSNSSKEDAIQFKQQLDLSESYIYQASANGTVLYRVVWGAYPNRARAQLAVQSLPEEILQQKPWLRSFASIANDWQKLNP